MYVKMDGEQVRALREDRDTILQTVIEGVTDR